MFLNSPEPVANSPAMASNTKALRQAAEQIEVSFMTEMLKSAGFGAPRDTFGGGSGEDQFASFLRRAQAEEMVRAGGLGLAEHLFQALTARNNVR